MTTAAAPNSAQRPLPKVLRIGLVQEGKIVQERLMKAGESVFVGTGPNNTFDIPGAPMSKMELFTSKGINYTLNFHEKMDGKISLKDGIRDLEELRKATGTTKKGELYSVSLTEEVKGKVVVGTTTLLFQFVPAPPEPVRVVTKGDFRPRWFDNEDPLFMNLLIGFNIVFLVFSIWVRLTPMPEKDEMELIEAAAAMIKPVSLPEPEPTQVVDEGDKSETKAETKSASKSESKAQSKSEGGDAKSKAESHSLVLQFFSAQGAGAGEVGADDDEMAAANLAAALNGVNSTVASATGLGMVRDGSAQLGSANVQLGSGTGGTGTGVGGAGGGQIKIQARAQAEGGDIDAEEGDASGVESIMRKNSARIRTCSERALAANPNVKGRISVTLSIVTGKVVDVKLSSNQTGDSGLGDCVVRAVRTFRFDANTTATVDSYTWVISAQ